MVDSPNPPCVLTSAENSGQRCQEQLYDLCYGRREDEARALTHDKPKRKADTFWRRSKKTPRKLLVGVVRFRLRTEISISPPNVKMTSPPNLRRG